MCTIICAAPCLENAQFATGWKRIKFFLTDITRRHFTLRVTRLYTKKMHIFFIGFYPFSMYNLINELVRNTQKAIARTETPIALKRAGDDRLLMK